MLIDDYKIVYAFLIDLKYVVNTWNKKKHSDDVLSLIEQIEEIQTLKSKPKRHRITSEQQKI